MPKQTHRNLKRLLQGEAHQNINRYTWARPHDDQRSARSESCEVLTVIIMIIMETVITVISTVMTVISA